MSKTRNSSVELLRILSMLTIVAVHYLGNNDLQELTKTLSLEGGCFIVLNTVFNYGVNIFVIISGYYMCETTEVCIIKILKLLFDVAFYGICMYFVGVFFGVNNFSSFEIIKAMFPIFAGHRWFVKAYMVMFLLAPFTGKLLSNLNQKAHLTLIFICTIFLPLWPSFFPYPPIDDYGFDFVHFILLFIISGYLRKYIKIINEKICVLLLVGSSLVTVSVKMVSSAGISIPGLSVFTGYALAHNNPFNIIACCSVFLLFAKREFHSKVINLLAASSFAVYLIHGDPNMMKFIFNRLFFLNYLWIIIYGFRIYSSLV